MRNDDLDAVFKAKADNIRRAWEHYTRRDVELSSRPFRGIIELTQNCNFRCTMCAQSWEEKYARYNPALNMPLEELVRIGDQLFPQALLIDLRGFGESTILPYWPDVLDYLEHFPLVEWNILTNLALPRDEVWEKMVKLDFSIGFSCDAASKELFEAIRVRAHFERILHNLGVVTESIKRHGRGFAYFVSTIQRKNLHELLAIVELARDYGVTEVQFKAVQSDNRDLLLEGVAPAFIRHHASAALDAALEAGIRLTFNDRLFTRDLDPEKLARVSAYRPRKDRISEFIARHGLTDQLKLVADTVRVSQHHSCFKSFSFIFVDHRSKAGTCNHMMHPEILEMGDLKIQSLAEVWNGKPYRDFRAEHLAAKPTDPRCQWCFAHRIDD